MNRFEGKVALLTGAGGYIGGTSARRFAAEGAKVFVCDYTMEIAQRTVDAIRAAGGEAEAFAGDVRDSKFCDAAVAECVKRFGGIDIMVHVAGGSARGKMAKLIDQTDDVVENILGVNLLGAIWMSRAAAREMVKAGKGGRIICFSSVVARCGLKKCVDYAAAKGGVSSMICSLAKELGEDKITVNAVAPGIVVRPDDNSGENITHGTNFLHEKCLADDVANVVLFLSSEEGRFVTGQTYAIDGGRSLAMKGSD